MTGESLRPVDPESENASGLSLSLRQRTLQRYHTTVLSERGLMGWAALEVALPFLPVEIVLIPLTLRQPSKATRYAAIATLFSMVGAVYSYAIGHLSERLMIWDGVHAATPWIDWMVRAFDNWGEGIVFLGALMPLPFVVFALFAGMLNMGLLPFIATVSIGRALRFFVVTRLVTHPHKH